MKRLTRSPCFSRFWKMAKTFTGLKLQGAIGKFGITDLSDIVGAIDLLDGRVISGSEYGKILVWTGVFVSVLPELKPRFVLITTIPNLPRVFPSSVNSLDAESGYERSLRS